MSDNSVGPEWNSAGSCRHGISLAVHCDECAQSMTTSRERELISDWDRIDYIERRLQVPALIKRDDGTMAAVTSWALVGPVGRSLRETIDGLIKAEILARASRAEKGGW